MTAVTLAFAMLSSGAAAAGVIEEMIVTATKRAENVQDVPIAISAFTGADLDDRGVTDLYGLQEVSPSISVYSSNSTSNGGTIRIRGVGTTGNNPGLEAAVGTFIDGVYRSRAGQAFSDLVDIERIEILRGPQGTLFGKNTSAGAVAIHTAQPEFEPEGHISISAGDFDSRRVQASYTGPLIDDLLAFRISGNYHERDGIYEDDFRSDAYDGRDRYTLKGQLLWTPTDRIESRFIFDYTDKDEDCCPANYYSINSTVQSRSATSRARLLSGEPNGAIIQEILARNGRPAEVAVDPTQDDEVGVNFAPFEEVEEWGIQNTTVWDLSDTMTLTGIISYREFEVQRGQDIDFSAVDLLEPQFTSEKFENFSIELQLTGTAGDVDWLVGGYAYTEDIVTDESIRLSTDGPEFLSRIILSEGVCNAIIGTPLCFAGDNPTAIAVFGASPDDAGTPDIDEDGVGQFNPITRQLEALTANRPNYLPGDGYEADFEQETEGWSIFTHNVWHITDRLDLTIGARFSSEEKEATTIINGVQPLVGTQTEIAAQVLANVVNEAHCEGTVAVGSLCDNVPWTDDREEDEWTGTIRLSYALTDDINVYAGYSRGYKAGGFNLDQSAIEIDYFGSFLAAGGNPSFLDPDNPLNNNNAQLSTNPNIPNIADGDFNGKLDPGCTGTFADGTGEAAPTNPGPQNAPCTVFDDDHEFDPEFVDSYEIGLKGEFLDRTLTANIAVFYSDFEDFQLNTFTGTGFLISNTNSMVAKGVEVETMWNTPIDGVFATLGVTYADARYGGSLNASNATERDLYLAATTPGDYDILEDFAALENIEGRRLTHAPKWQGSASLFIERQIPNTDVMGLANFNVGFRGAHNTGSDLDREKQVDNEFLVNAQLGVRTMDEQYEATFWVRNLTDNQVSSIVFDSVFQFGSYSRFFNTPRMMGVTLTANF